MKQYLLRYILFAGLAVCSMAASAQTPSFQGLAFNQSGGGAHLTFRNFPSFQLVTFKGELDLMSGGPLVERLARSLIYGKPVTLIISGSNGGKIISYRRFASVLRSACPKGSCRITTYVRDLCASACVDLFMQGDLRVSSPTAVFGFHREFFSVGPYDFAVESRRGLSEYYVQLGAHPNGMRAITEQLAPALRECVWVRADDAARFGIVHRFEVPNDVPTKFRAFLPSDFSDHFEPLKSAKFFESSSASAGAR